MSGISEHNWVIEAAMARDDFAGTFAGVVVRRLNNLISTHDSDITWEKEAALEMARAVQLIERLHSGDDAQAAQVPQVPSAAQIEAAWHAFENCPIDLVGDSDEEQKKCVIAAVKAALAAQPPAAPVETEASIIAERLRTLAACEDELSHDCASQWLREAASFIQTTQAANAAKPPAAPVETAKHSPDECGRECQYYDYFEMLWNWFADESRRGAEDMRANAANGGLSADDFKGMLDDHEANLIPVPPQVVQVTDAMCEAAVKADQAERIQGFTYEAHHVIRDVWKDFSEQKVWEIDKNDADAEPKFRHQCRIERMRKVLDAALEVTRPEEK